MPVTVKGKLSTSVSNDLPTTELTPNIFFAVSSVSITERGAVKAVVLLPSINLKSKTCKNSGLAIVKVS